MFFQTCVILGAMAVLFLLNLTETNRRAQEIKAELRRLNANASDALLAETAKTRRFLKMIVAGEPPTPEMIEDGVFWRDATGAEAQALVQASNARVLDVRTADETASGMLPDAQHVPIEQLEERVSEVQDDGRPLLIYCAGGARSAAACEFLSQRGFRGPLHNLAGGIGAWPGSLER